MITYQVEKFSEVKPEMEDLIKMHYDEVALHKEYIPLDPDWDRYSLMEKNGALFIATARNDGDLKGYSWFFISNHIHYKSTKVAANDVLFLHPDYRKGTTGVKLIKFSEEELKKLDVNKIVWHIKFHKDFRNILYRMGYADEDAIVGKIIKE